MLASERSAARPPFPRIRVNDARLVSLATQRVAEALFVLFCRWRGQEEKSKTRLDYTCRERKIKAIHHLVHAELPDFRAEGDVFLGVVPVEVRGYQALSRPVEKDDLGHEHAGCTHVDTRTKSSVFECNRFFGQGGTGERSYLIGGGAVSSPCHQMETKEHA